MFNKFSIKSKTVLFFLLSIILVIGISLIVVVKEIQKSGEQRISHNRELLLKLSKNELKNNTMLAQKAIEKFYNQSLDKNIANKLKIDALQFKNLIQSIYNKNKDLLTDQEMRKLILEEVLPSYRYNNGIGYFFAYNMKGVNVAHPIKPSLIGKNLYNLKDKSGNFVIRDIIKSVKNGNGITKYKWENPKSKKIENKISYSFYFKPFDIVIGTGDYASNIKQYYQQKAIDIIENLRYGKNGYFFGYKIEKDGYYFAFHGVKHQLAGKKTNIDKPDIKGNKFRRKLIEGAIKNESNGVFVKYYYMNPKTKKVSQKIAYAKYFKEWNWVIATGKYLNDIDKITKLEEKNIAKSTNNIIYRLLVINFIILLIITLIAYLLINKIIAAPLNNLTKKAKELSSGDGDLTKKLEIHGDDEIAQASKEINNFIEKVRVITDEAKHISNENSSIANELSSTALEVGKLVENSTKATNETSTKTQEIKQRLETAVDGAKTARGDLEKVNEHMGQANRAILSLAHSIQSSASKEIELADKIQQLSSDAEQIKSVLTVISDIADQTNLLALNAAIEAARAGEHGKGFAVVADEVRKLAERTQKSLVEINATINVIVQSIVESSEEMSINSRKVEELANSATSVEEKINEMSDMVNNAATKTSDAIERSYSETQEDVDEIVEQVSTINTISTQNARSMEEIASAAEHLNSMTETLNNKLGEFRT